MYAKYTYKYVCELTKYAAKFAKSHKKLKAKLSQLLSMLAIHHGQHVCT